MLVIHTESLRLAYPDLSAIKMSNSCIAADSEIAPMPTARINLSTWQAEWTLKYLR